MIAVGTAVKPVPRLAGDVAVPWGVVAFVLGLLYGWLASGRHGRQRLLRRGLLIGAAVALLLVAVGWQAGWPALGRGGALASVWSALVMGLLFVLGVWIGDLIDGAVRRSRS